MRQKRSTPASIAAVSMALMAWAPSAAAQTRSQRCAPVVEVADSVPARLAQRLRRVLDLAAQSLPSPPDCQRSRVRLVWSAHELTVHIALDDGRVAVRTLDSLDDVLPTMLSVMAVPAPDPPPTPEPVPATQALVVLVAPVAPRVAVVAPLPPVAPRRSWGLLVSGSLGASLLTDDGLQGFGRLELGVASPVAALALRATVARGDDDSGSHNPTPGAARRRHHDPFEPALVLSARWRWSALRLREEVGVFGGVAQHADRTSTAELTRWAPRLGVEASMGWQFLRPLGAFVRAEGFVDVSEESVFGLGLSLGVTWEPMR